VTAIPAVVGGAVYFPDWGGYLNKVDAASGTPIWSQPVSSYDGVKSGVSRSAPAVVGNSVYIGDLNGGHLSAVSATTGKLIWTRQLDSSPYAILTAGPLVYGGVVYQGVSSSEEGAAGMPGYRCCTFRGSIVAVSAATGAILWKTYMTPSNGGRPCTQQSPARGCGYSGAAIWSTTPAIDAATNTLFVTTGNNYTVPDSVKTCEANGGSPGKCLSPRDHVDSIVALDVSTGAIKWATGTGRFDDWNLACVPGHAPNNCPANPGPDYDFGSGPNLFTITNAAGQRELVVGAGEKSGQYWALDAATGKILWSQAAGPGGSLGGILWGTATDGKRIYVAEADYNGIPYTLPSGQSITSGSWAAIDPATGKVLWQTPDPSHNSQGGGNAVGPVSVANGVVYAPSLSGHVYGLNAATGSILWDHQLAAAEIGGAAIVNGNVFWGDGNKRYSSTGTNTFYDFSLNGR
jgi:polyvinyl alcohol dehydrogenase (cytochrome)